MAQNGEFVLDYRNLVKTMVNGGFQAENKIKKNKKKNSLKYWATGLRS